MTTLLSKFIAPVFIGAILGVIGIIGVQRATKQEIKVGCPTPVCNCDCPPPVNSIDFDKIKGFKGTITLNQQYHMELKSDSLVNVAIRAEFLPEIERIMKELKVARCR